MKNRIMNLKHLITKSKLARNNLILAIVALVEIIAIMVVSTSAWVETISTIYIANPEMGKIAAPVLTTAKFDAGSSGELDLSKFFNESGDVHLASASSADGENIFFPKLGTTGFRKGTIDDINVNYICFSIIIDATKAAGDLNFFFKSDPVITIGDEEVTDSSVRLAVSKDGAPAKIFSKAESASDAVIDVDGNKSSTSFANKFFDFAQGNASEDNPVFDVAYGQKAEVTFALWLEDPDMTSAYTGKSVKIQNLMLVTDAKEYNVSFVDRTTSFYNGGTANGLYWVGNSNAEMWVYNSGLNKAVKMTKDLDDATLWTANLQEFTSHKTSDLYFMRTSPDAENPTPSSGSSVVYNIWQTKLSEDTTLGKVYTAYSNVVGTSTKYGTWGKVTEITLDTEDLTTLPKPATDSSAADISLKVSNVTYEMNYKTYNSKKLWRCYMPTDKLADTVEFKFRRGSTTYTYDAVKRRDSLQYVITSSNTGYWVPPAIIQVIGGVHPGSLEDGTAIGTYSASVGNYSGYEIKVTPGTEIQLNANDSENYRFMGWYTNSEYTAGADLTDGNKFTPEESITYVFYARYQRQYHVRLKAVASDGTNDKAAVQLCNKKYPNGTTDFNSEVDTYLLNDDNENASVFFKAKTYEPAGYQFMGWYDNASGTGDPVSIDLNYEIPTVERDYTLYAVFKLKQFTVKAVAKPGDVDDGMGNSTVTFTKPAGADTGTEVEVTVNYKNEAIFKANADSSHGYVFKGWYLNPEMTNKASDNNPYTRVITGELTLYAKFELKTVTLRAVAVTGTTESSDGGTVKITDGDKTTAGLVDTKTVKYGTPIEITAAAKTGYDFVGWYTSVTGGSPASGLVDGCHYTDDKIVIAGLQDDISLFARFKPRQFTVTAVAKCNDVDGEVGNNKVKFNNPLSISGAEVSVTVDYNNKAVFEALPDANEGYVFEGWYTHQDLKPEHKLDSTNLIYTESSITSNVTLYANFVLKNITVNAHAVTGTTVDSATGGTVKISEGTAASAGAKDSKQIKYGKTVTLIAQENEGYKFLGWYTAASGGDRLSLEKEYTTEPIKPGTANSYNVYARFNRGTTTIYFDDRTNFSEYHAWVYNAADTSKNYTGGTWPGEKLERDPETGYYKWTKEITDSGNFGVVVSDNGKNQYPGSDANGLQGEIGKTYFFATGSPTSLKEFDPAKVNYKAVSYDASGNKLENGFEGGSISVGLEIYTSDKTLTRMKNSTIKSNALPSANYEFKGWYSDEACTQSVGTVQELSALLNAGEVTYYAKFVEKQNLGSPYYLLGINNNWTEDDNTRMAYTDSSKKFVKYTVNLTSDTYSFKVKTGTTWYTNDDSTISAGALNVPFGKTDGADAQVNITAAGEYTFTFNIIDKTMSITSGGSGSDTVTITFTHPTLSWITQEGTSMYVFYNNSRYPMTQTPGERVWTVEIPSNVTDIKFHRGKYINNNEFQRWTLWEAGSRGTSTTYEATGGGPGDGSWK